MLVGNTILWFSLFWPIHSIGSEKKHHPSWTLGVNSFWGKPKDKGLCYFVGVKQPDPRLRSAKRASYSPCPVGIVVASGATPCNRRFPLDSPFRQSKEQANNQARKQNHIQTHTHTPLTYYALIAHESTHSHARTPARPRAHTHTCTHARAHTDTRTPANAHMCTRTPTRTRARTHRQTD